MFQFSALYQVPTGLRLLTGAGAVVTAVALPLLLSSGSKLQVMLVGAAGLFAASVAIFGRKHAGSPSPRARA